jgi:hypothetical protein
VILNKTFKAHRVGPVYVPVASSPHTSTSPGYKPMVNLLDGVRNTAIYIASDVLGWNDKLLDELSSQNFGIPRSGKRGGEALKSREEDEEEPVPTGVPMV